MQNAYLMLLLLIGALHPAAAVADDAGVPRSDGNRLRVMTDLPETLQLVNEYSSRWRLSHPTEAAVVYEETSAAMADIDFQDPGALARVSKIRELSLLTLAEVGRTRLFLGVSERGLLGFHLGAMPQLGDERCLEFARMPYLADRQQDDGAE